VRLTLILENSMKSFFTRRSAAVILALGLAACGGKAMFEIKGVVAGPAQNYDGLLYDGLVLVNNGGSDLSVPAKATTFAFPNSIEYGSTFKVTVKTHPAHQFCQVINGEDTAGRLASINMGLGCNVLDYTIGGTVTGLTTEGLVLINGTTGGGTTILKGATSFTFAATVKYGVSYGVTIFKQPTGQTCTVENGSGVMGDANVSNLKVSCV
jgi:hypothetical protein